MAKLEPLLKKYLVPFAQFYAIMDNSENRIGEIN